MSFFSRYDFYYAIEKLLLLLAAMTTTAMVCDGLVTLAVHRPAVSPSSSFLRASTPHSSVEFLDPETGCEVVLLGCFHGAQSSARDVEKCLHVDNGEAAEPNTVVVLELCASRFIDLRNDIDQREKEESNGAKPDMLSGYISMVQKTSQARGIATGLAAGLLGLFSLVQTTVSGLEPGLEFETAYLLAKNRSMDIILADQAVEETLSNIGQLPSLQLFQSLFQKGWKESYGLEVQTLGTAVLGDFRLAHQLSLGRFLTRSGDAVSDILGLLLPPWLLVQGLVFIFGAVCMLLTPASYAEALRTSTGGGSVVDPILVDALAFGAIYFGVALPASRVVLRERDNFLSNGIQEACRLATSGNGRGRVVAVLGLLHVNGVARRMLERSQPNTTKSEQ